ncbi:MAG: secretin N-terminal domain-containing protein [Puniceicoccales bacterium]
MKIQTFSLSLLIFGLMPAIPAQAQEDESSNPIQQAIEVRDKANANMERANSVLDDPGDEESGAPELSPPPPAPATPEATPPADLPLAEPIPEPSVPAVASEPAVAPPPPVAATPAPEELFDRFDLDYTDTPIRTILRNVADAAELNVIIPDSLVGNLSLQLKSVTWPQVYDIALERTGFVWEETSGGIIRIQRVGADQAIKIGDDGFLSVNFRGEPTRTAVQALAEVVGLNIIIPSELSGTTSASLTNVAWERVLTTILEDNGYQWFENDGIIGIRAIDSRVIVDPQSGTLNISVEGTPFQEIATLIGQTQTPSVNVVSPPEIENLPISLEVTGVTFEQALNLAILKLPKVSIGAGGQGAAQQYQSYSTYQAGPNLVQIVDQQFLNSLRNEPPIVRIYDLRYASAGDLLLKIMPSPGDTSESSNGAIPSFRQAAAGGVQPVIDGVQSVAADHANNLLLVTARPASLTEVTALIERLDQPLKQILIESKFVEITGQDGKNLGVDWSTLQGWGINASPFSRTWTRERSQTNTGTTVNSNNTSFSDTTSRSIDTGRSYDGTNLSTSEFGVPITQDSSQTSSLAQSDFTTRAINNANSGSTSYTDTLENVASTSRLDTAIFSTDEFRVILRALEEESDAKLITNPNVVAINGKQARVELTDYYYKSGPTETNDGVTTTGEPIPLEPRPGTTLVVTPTVVGGQLISLNVVPQVNSIVSTQTIDGNEIPIVRRRATDSEVLLRSGSTLAIGGLITDENVTDSNKVPVLGDIPILGRLFSSETTSVQTTNQIIFITASLLNPQSNTYMDVVGIDRFNEMGLTDREVQGVGARKLSPEELQLQQAVRKARNEAATEEIMNALRMRETIEETEEAELEDAAEEIESKETETSNSYYQPRKFGPVGRK